MLILLGVETGDQFAQGNLCGGACAKEVIADVDEQARREVVSVHTGGFADQLERTTPIAAPHLGHHQAMDRDNLMFLHRIDATQQAEHVRGFVQAVELQAQGGGIRRVTNPALLTK